MNIKQEHYIFGLLGIGAVILFYFLYKESTTASNTATSVAPVPASGVQPNPYPAPAVAPIQLGNVYLGDTPGYQSGNISTHKPSVQVGNDHSECGCDDNDCEQAGTAVTVQSIPDDVLTAASLNLSSWQAKFAPSPATGTSGVPAHFLGAPVKVA